MAVLDPNEIMFKAFEPKVQNRFVMLIDNIPSFMVKNVKAPTFTDNVIKLDHINSYRKIRGKREWDDMTMTLYDPVTPSGAQAVMEWARQGYESVTGRAGYSDFYKKDLTLNILGPVGDIVEKWTLYGTYIQDATFGDLDFTTSDPVEITLQLKYDYAILEF